MSKIKIYTSHHKPSAFLSSNIIVPIHVGKGIGHNDIGCNGDDFGDNISYKNPFYCELTAQYWVWKNALDSDYIGFMHYRRHLNFSENQSFEEDNWGVVCDSVISPEYERKFGLNETEINSCIGNNDILLPKKWDVRAAGSKNNYHHYRISQHLHISDYQLALDSLLRLYPEYSAAVNEFNEATDGYYTNMFVMKKEIFSAYSEWLFTVLSEVEDHIYFKNYSTQEKRVIGHISERLFNIYLIHLLKTENVTVKEVQRTFVETETFNGRLIPAFNNNNIPIVISFDDNYSISGAALINSIVSNSSTKFNYDIVVLENSITTKNKVRLKSIIKNINNFSLRFFDVNAFSEMKMVYTRAHFSASTYARLFIPRLFDNYDKVLFIDADTIVESDVSELINIELGNNLVAAVKDIVMEGFVKFGATADLDSGEVIPADKYLAKHLGMTNPDRYFQAGIILFNIKKMVEENTFSQLMVAMKSMKYWFLDQDIMNKVFYNRVHYLPLEWNVYHGNGNTDDFFPNLKFSTYMKFLAARKNPKMIHFAGDKKPWNTNQVDYFDNFNRYITHTPWAAELIERLNGIDYSKVSVVENKTLLQTKLKRKLMPLVNNFAPVGTHRRRVMVLYYYKIRRAILG
jgi:lipopolysaccharide biosynthesis glycosyltransferase